MDLEKINTQKHKKKILTLLKNRNKFIKNFKNSIN